LKESKEKKKRAKKVNLGGREGRKEGRNHEGLP
jgi:hypothetical protein